MSEWKEYRLGDYCQKIGSGATPRGGSNVYKTHGVALIRSQNVMDLHFSTDGLAYIDDEQADLLKNVSVENDDILLNITGDSVARVCKAPEHLLPARVNQHVAIVRVIPNILYSEYVLYYLIHLKPFLLAHSEIGGTRNALTKGMIENLTIYAPSNIKDQMNVADILSSLDDKIDLLHRQNVTLEAMAETLFRQWFVEEAEEGWEVVKVADVAEINSKSISKSFPYSEIEYLDTGSITDGVVSSFQTVLLADAPSRAQRIVDNNDIVYSLVRPIQRHFGFLNGIANNTVVSTGFCVISAKNFSPHFLYILLTKDESVEYFDMIAEASTSTYPSLKPSDIANFEFQKPPQKKLTEYSEFASGLWSKINTNNQQIRTLTLLRDNLLPKLMSGDVKVKM